MKKLLIILLVIIFSQSCKPTESELTMKDKLCIPRNLQSGYDSTFIKFYEGADYFFSYKTEYSSSHIFYVTSELTYKYKEQMSLNHDGSFRQTIFIIADQDTIKSDYIGIWDFAGYDSEEQITLYTEKLIANDTLEMQNNGIRPNITYFIDFIDEKTLKVKYEIVTNQGESMTKVKGGKTFQK